MGRAYRPAAGPPGAGQPQPHPQWPGRCAAPHPHGWPVAAIPGTFGQQHGPDARNGLRSGLGEQRGRGPRAFSPVRDIRAAISPVTIGVEKDVPLHCAMP